MDDRPTAAELADRLKRRADDSLGVRELIVYSQRDADLDWDAAARLRELADEVADNRRICLCGLEAKLDSAFEDGRKAGIEEGMDYR